MPTLQEKTKDDSDDDGGKKRSKDSKKKGKKKKDSDNEAFEACGAVDQMIIFHLKVADFVRIWSIKNMPQNNKKYNLTQGNVFEVCYR